MKKERGAITIITLTTVLFMLAFLISTYIIIENRRQAQLETKRETLAIYEKDVDNVDEIYTEMAAKIIKCDEHTLGDWTITKQATCTEKGEKQATCSVCGEVVTEEIEIDTVNGHDYSVATCTTLATCSRCGATTGSLGAHNYSNGKCTVCSRCQIEYSLTNITKTTGAETIAANGTETIVITAKSGYELPDSVTVTGATKESYTKSTGTIVIKNPTGKVTITANGVEKQHIPTTTSYVGKYAYVNGTYGIIFADLAVPKSGTGLGVSYSYPGTKDATSGFKKYYVKDGGQKTDDFGTADVIALDTSSTGNDRFYVMALDDVDANQHYWYYNAYNNMSDYASTTSVNFGEGKTNTANMLTKWNNASYGAKTTSGKDYTDMWSLIPSGSSWFVPSKTEWAAFAGELGCFWSVVRSVGLKDCYWSSSQYSRRLRLGRKPFQQLLARLRRHRQHLFPSVHDFLICKN